MDSTVIPDISPAELLGRFRGRIFTASRAYPETIQFKLRDAEGGEWWLATQWADYSPSDPDAIVGKTVVGAELNERSGDLTLTFSDGTAFRAISRPQEEPGDDLEHWDLFTPEGLVLIWGPDASWKLKSASDPP
ncbi:MAG TPA: hypothetical protein VGH14_03215 [Solirubrobacterales bacterium]